MGDLGRFVPGVAIALVVCLALLGSWFVWVTRSEPPAAGSADAAVDAAPRQGPPAGDREGDGSASRPIRGPGPGRTLLAEGAGAEPDDDDGEARARRGYVDPPEEGALDPARLRETGAALSRPWMPALSPEDAGWDPVIEARQRFATLEAALEEAAAKTSAEHLAVLGEHADEIGAMQQRLASLRDAGHADAAQQFESEWARLEAAWATKSYDGPPPLDRTR